MVLSLTLGFMQSAIFGQSEDLKIKRLICVTEGTFKQRKYAHKLSFSNKNYSHNTNLSAYIWKLKVKNSTSSITSEVIKPAPACNKISRICLLCIHEKVVIVVVYSYTYRCKQKHNDELQWTNEHTSLKKKYTSNTLFLKGLRKGWCWLCVRGELETGIDCHILN